MTWTDLDSETICSFTSVQHESETMGDFKETNRKLMQPEPLSQIVLMMSPSVLTCTACFQHLTHVLDNNSWWLLKNEEVGCCSVTLRFVRGCGSCQEALFIQEEMVVWLLHHSNSAHWLIFLSQCIKMCREPVLRHAGWIARYHGKTCGHNTNMKRDHVHHSSLYKSVWCSKTGPKRGFTVFSFCFVHLK